MRSTDRPGTYGKSVADGAMMIDLSLMREVQVDAGKQTALPRAVRPGAYSIASARNSGLPRPAV
jgi:hypothetical protein